MYLNISFPGEISISDSKSHFTSFLAGIASQVNRCLIVAGGQQTQNSDAFSMVSNFMSNHGVQVFVLPHVDPNPEASVVVEGSIQAQRAAVDAIFTIGGGSSHDTGKLISVLAKQRVDLGDLVVEKQGYEKISKDVLPVFCIPTLAGTGAEISPASLVKIYNEKKIIFSRNLRPQKTYYCLPLMFSADYETNILTAFDAYVQSLEAYLSRAANPWSDMLALSGMRDSVSGLLSFARDQSSTEARRLLVYAAIKGIMAVSNASVGGIHALSDPLSGRCSIHHEPRFRWSPPQCFASTRLPAPRVIRPLPPYSRRSPSARAALGIFPSWLKACWTRSHDPGDRRDPLSRSRCRIYSS